jgi:hypothetical protein
VTLVIVGIVLLACGIPAITYATLESGPHQSLPELCAAMNRPVIQQLVGSGNPGTRERPARDGLPTTGCSWRGDDLTSVEIVATRFTKSMTTSSVARAKAQFEADELKLDEQAWTADPRGIFSRLDSTGDPDPGYCAAMLSGSDIWEHCFSLADNVELEMDVRPSGSGAFPDVVQVARIAQNFLQVARDLTTDYFEEL